MGDYGHELWFGAFLTPDARQADHIVDLAQLADQIGLDLLGVQDHPYQPRFLDTWTLLSALAAQTKRIRLVPDVINLPLRPPAVLARAVASLDVLSGGRVELGLGAGAFADAVAGMGGPARSPAESIDALAEAIHVIRALWAPGPPVQFAGKHYQLRGAQPGPFPPHPVGIWLGAYKPRMLRLTGELADGWIPSSPYAPPEQLPEMSRVIDAAARAAGRDPAAIRRVYNVNGRFMAAEQGFLQGPPRLWAEQLAELALQQGISVFITAPGADAANDLRRFAEDVAPAVRELVAQARAGGVAASAPAAAGSYAPPAPIREPVAGTAPGRSSAAPVSTAWDESMRPRLPQSGAPVSTVGRQSQEMLIQVHEHLRQELAQIRDAAEQVATQQMEPAAARSLIYQLTLRQNFWTLGSFCAQYCRVVSLHHTIEDERVFPSLERKDGALGPVLERLSWEHEIIAEQLERFDQALVAMMEEPGKVVDVRRVADDLNSMLLSHLAYEEDELLGPIGRLNIAL